MKATTFRERVHVLRAMWSGEPTRTTLSTSAGEADLRVVPGGTLLSYRARWDTPWSSVAEQAALAGGLPVSVALEQLGGEADGCFVRVVERRRAIEVLDETGDWATDATFHTRVLVDGRGARAGVVRERAWFTAPLGELAVDDLRQVVQRALSGSQPTEKQWPWRTGQVHLPVVFAPGIGGIAFHEAVGHLLESEPGRRAPKLGTGVAGTAVTVIDDPTLPGLWGSRNIDDEGERAQAIVLVDRGVVAGLLHTTQTSPTGGQARRADYRSRPLARMSNTYLAPGNEDEDDLLAGEVVLRCMAGGSAEVRPGTRDVVMRIREAEVRRRGEPAGVLRHLTLQFETAQLMHGVEGVARDVTFLPGRCVKERQSLPVSHGAPAFRLSRALVTAGAAMMRRP